MADQPRADTGGPIDSGSPLVAPDTGSAGQADLDAYVTANAGRFTDDALYGALVAAGHSPDEARAALARGRTLTPERAAPRARRTILIAYFGVFALLSIGMLLNGRGRGYLMPDAAGGIALLAGSLGVALVASLVWVASRQLFTLFVALIIVAYALLAITSGAGGLPLGLVIVFVIGGGFVFLARRRSAGISGGGAVQTDIAVLLLLPMLLLIAIAGICVASGMPIPGGTAS
jgi:hypothetical protein